MVAIAAGQYRFAVRDAAGYVVATSTAIAYDVFDNVASPRPFFPDPRGYQRATINDEPHVLNEVINGPTGEILELQFFDTSARTFTTASCVVRFNVARKARRNGVLQWDERPLVLGDRVTKSTAGTVLDPAGLNDNPATIANEWSPVMRFIPRKNENWVLCGPQYFLSDGT